MVGKTERVEIGQAREKKKIIMRAFLKKGKSNCDNLEKLGVGGLVPGLLRAN